MWILFVFIGTFNGPTITTAEFSTGIACQQAGESVKQFNAGNDIQTMCLFKSTGEKQ